MMENCKIWVASFAEAWIEIPTGTYPDIDKYVASFAEAWIEICVFLSSHKTNPCRLLRGGVD